MRLGRKNANDLDATPKNAALGNENVMKRVAARKKGLCSSSEIIYGCCVSFKNIFCPIKKVYVPVVKYFMAKKY
jgi:hypothetical protein